MKIKVRYVASPIERSGDIDLSELGITEDEWNLLSTDEKEEKLTDAVEHDTPSWFVANFEEVK